MIHDRLTCNRRATRCGSPQATGRTSRTVMNHVRERVAGVTSPDTPPLADCEWEQAPQQLDAASRCLRWRSSALRVVRIRQTEGLGPANIGIFFAPTPAGTIGWVIPRGLRAVATQESGMGLGSRFGL